MRTCCRAEREIGTNQSIHSMNTQLHSNILEISLDDSNLSDIDKIIKPYKIKPHSTKN